MKEKKTEKPFKVAKAKVRVKNTPENTYDGHKAIPVIIKIITLSLLEPK